MKKYIKKHWNTIENGLLIILCIYLLIEMGGKGFMYWIAAIILIGLIRLYRYKDYFLHALLYPIQKILWGKPLVKGLWKEGEFKHVKKQRIGKIWKGIGRNPFRKGDGDNKEGGSNKPLRTDNCTKKDAETLQQTVQQVQKKVNRRSPKCTKQPLHKVQEEVQDNISKGKR